MKCQNCSSNEARVTKMYGGDDATLCDDCYYEMMSEQQTENNFEFDTSDEYEEARRGEY